MGKDQKVDTSGLQNAMIEKVREKYIDLASNIIESGEFHVEQTEQAYKENKFAAELIAKYNPKVIMSDEEFEKLEDEELKMEVNLYRAFDDIASQYKDGGTNQKFRLENAKQLKGRLETLPTDSNELDFLFLFDKSFKIGEK